MAEFGLFVCVIATSFGLVRIVEGYGFLGRLCVVAAAASALAALLRRRGVGTIASAIAHLGIGTLLLSNLFLFSTTFYGIPTLETMNRVRLLATDSIIDLRSSVPPIVPSTGLLVVVAGAIWALTFFADTAAFRVHAPVQAVLPLTAAFLALGVPDSDAGKLESVVVFGSGMCIYALTVQYTRDKALRWLGPNERGASRGTARLAGSTAATVIVALILASVFTAALPSPKPVIKLRGQKALGGRVVTTPFVGIRNLLGERTNAEMFTVNASMPSYWRLTALDTYDIKRDIWVSSGKYSKLGPLLPRSTSSSVKAERAQQHFDIAGLTGPWVPAAYEPVEYDGDPVATFNEATSTLFADSDVSRGDKYDVVSYVPAFSTDELASVRRGDPEGTVDSVLLEVPEESPVLRSVLDDIVLRSSGPYDGMLALQDWFRSNFDYDESVDYSESEDPVSEFLTRREGFCQQFSSVFALMARYAGLPSRVAVGFTMGEEGAGSDPNEDVDAEDGTLTFVVKGVHAHAWPEVLFPGLGWVPFEPTPGRGNPATTAFTGVVGAQASADQSGATTTSTKQSSTTSASASASIAPVTSSPSVTSVDDGTQSATGDDSTSTSRIIAGAGLVLLAILGLLLATRRRRRTPNLGSAPILDPDSEQIASAWRTAVKSLARVGIPLREHDTPHEFSNRCAAQIHQRMDDDSLSGILGENEELSNSAAVLLDQMDRLASIETLRRYSSEFALTETRDQNAIDALVEESERCAHLIAAATDRLVEGIPGVSASTVVDVPH